MVLMYWRRGEKWCRARSLGVLVKWRELWKWPWCGDEYVFGMRSLGLQLTGTFYALFISRYPNDFVGFTMNWSW